MPLLHTWQHHVWRRDCTDVDCVIDGERRNRVVPEHVAQRTRQGRSTGTMHDDGNSFVSTAVVLATDYAATTSAYCAPDSSASFDAPCDVPS